MSISVNMNKMQKTKGLDYLVEVELKTQAKQGAHSDLSAMTNLKAKSNFHTEILLEKIVNKRNIFEAYKRVKANKGSHGIDGMKVDELLPFLQAHYDILGGLKTFAEFDILDDPRCKSALDLLEKKRLDDRGWPSEKKYYTVSDSFKLNGDYVDWGGTSKKRFNDWVTTDVLYVLRKAKRINI